MSVNSDLAGLVESGAIIRSRLNFTTEASSGSPSWNFTPWRSLKTYSLPSSEMFQLSARPGPMAPVRSMRPRLSKMVGVVTSRMAAAAFLVGSSTGGSSDRPITRRSLAGPWAHAGETSKAPAAPRRWRREKTVTEWLLLRGRSLSAAEHVPPATRRAQRGGVPDATGHGAGETIRSQRAELAHGPRIGAEIVRAGGEREDGVAVQRRVGGADRTGEPILRHDRHPLGRW